jgi:UBX domain-containing protein 1
VREERPTNHFTGTGMTLGSDDTPSEVIPDPNTPIPRDAPPLHRTLTFWRDGFSVGDGPLMRYDDPANDRYLRDIRRGRAPADLLDVAPGQETNVEVFRRTDEAYVAPKPKGPFRGGGQRLGSPTPGPGVRRQEPAAVPATTASSSTGTPPSVDVDDSQPTISIQVRLGDGSRLVSRFNTTHTVGDVYSFVDRASPGSATRPWVLMTTFPSKQLKDKHVVLGDLSEFRRGGVVVQKWE